MDDKINLILGIGESVDKIVNSYKQDNWEEILEKEFKRVKNEE